LEKEITLPAEIDSIPVITDFVNEILEAADCPMKAETQIDIAIDELFSNIAYYAYGEEKGMATVKVELDEAAPSVSITFIDSGAPYNPLEKADPDVTLAAEDRGIGGLGIFIVKKSMNEVNYEYCGEQNRLTITKKW